MTKLNELFSELDGDCKSSIYKLIPIRDLIYWKTKKSVGYDVVCPYEWIVLSETTYWSSQEDVYKLVL